MKKVYLLIIGIVLIGCEKDEINDINSEIIGTWEWKVSILPGEVEGYNEDGYYNIREYKFNSNKTYESKLYFFNENTQEIEGYHSKEIGTYRIVNDTIFREFDLYYSNGTAEYEVVTEDSLLFEENVEYRHYFKLKDNDSKLTFKFSVDFERPDPTTEIDFIRIN
ncbi:hypothetical protein [Joostella sp.]|uniref:hypothetical protein n=1 Tax=Joostella sp. TaxID=2231138 RepID=UPI003A8E613C